jgi:hypothetical protein
VVLCELLILAVRNNLLWNSCLAGRIGDIKTYFISGILLVFAFYDILKFNLLFCLLHYYGVILHAMVASYAISIQFNIINKSHLF